VSYLNSSLSSFFFISPLPTPGIVSAGLIFPFTYMYIVFAPYSPSYTLSPHPPHSHWYQSLRQDLFCPPILFSDFVKENNGIFVCLRELYREFSCDISMCICMRTQIGPSPLFFSFLS
jgi:hypothetical protein